MEEELFEVISGLNEKGMQEIILVARSFLSKKEEDNVVTIAPP